MSAANSKGPLKIIIADDQTLFASSLKIVLDGYGDDTFSVIATVRNGRECIEELKAGIPDVILMDVRMPEMDGVEATRIIHKRHPGIKIMMLTTFDDDSYVSQALRNGATGYVLKNVEPDELVACIRAVSRGTMLVSPSVGYRLLTQPAPSPREEAEEQDYARKLNYLQTRFPDLTRREAEVLFLIVQGMDNQQIARTLFIAEQTTKNYISMICSKIGVEDRLHAIQLLGPLK